MPTDKGHGMWVPSILALIGFALSALVAVMVLRGAFVSLHPAYWRDRWDNVSFITFAWHEFGRALFLGFVAAAGFAPLAFAFFADSDRFMANVLFLTGVSWVAIALSIFFVGIVSTFIGFWRYELEHPERHSWFALIQFAVVAAFCLPLVVFFQIYLVPNLTTIVGLWFETMGLYARVVP